MQNNEYKYISLIVATIVSFACISCTFRPMLAEGMKVNLVIDADYTKEGGKVPELYCILFYDAATGNFATLSYVNPQGGEIHLPAGTYNYVIYNFDLEAVTVSEQENFSTLVAETSEAGDTYNTLVKRMEETRRKTAGEDTKNIDTPHVVYEPDNFLTETDQVTIPHRSTDDEIISITVHPKNIIRTATIEIRGLKNTQYISGITAYINAISGSYNPSNGKMDIPATQSVYCGYKGNDDIYRGSFRFFGMLDKDYFNHKENKAYAYLLLMDTIGASYLHTQEITEQLKEAVNTGNLNLKIRYDFEVPKPDITSQGGGFNPSLEDWNEEECPVPIG